MRPQARASYGRWRCGIASLPNGRETRLSGRPACGPPKSWKWTRRRWSRKLYKSPKALSDKTAGRLSPRSPPVKAPARPLPPGLFRDGASDLTAVIPGPAKPEPGTHNHGRSVGYTGDSAMLSTCCVYAVFMLGWTAPDGIECARL